VLARTDAWSGHAVLDLLVLFDQAKRIYSIEHGVLTYKNTSFKILLFKRQRKVTRLKRRPRPLHERSPAALSEIEN
jgi:hypothetical protein